MPSEFGDRRVDAGVIIVVDLFSDRRHHADPDVRFPRFRGVQL